MSWQETELARRRNEAEAEKLRLEQLQQAEAIRLKREQEIEKFWQQILNANEQLHSDLRLSLVGNELCGRTGSIHFNRNLINVMNSKNLCDFVIEYDYERKYIVARLVSERIFLQVVRSQIRKLNTGAINIIIQSLCTGRRISFADVT